MHCVQALSAGTTDSPEPRWDFGSHLLLGLSSVITDEKVYTCNLCFIQQLANICQKEEKEGEEKIHCSREREDGVLPHQIGNVSSLLLLSPPYKIFKNSQQKL